MNSQQMLNITIDRYSDLVKQGISHCEKAIIEGEIYESREETDSQNGFIYLAMMNNRLKDALEIFQKLISLTEEAASNFYSEESSDIGSSGRIEENIMTRGEQSITERLIEIERKVNLLVDTLGGEDNCYNGHYVCNDLFDIQTAAEAIEEFLKYGFPEAAKRAETNKREYEEAMKRLAKRFRERSIR